MQNDYDITMEDLPEELRDIAESIGIDDVIRLLKVRGGESVYMHKFETIIRNARNRKIRSAFKGRNYRELARRYNLTVRQIRQIVHMPFKTS